MQRWPSKDDSGHQLTITVRTEIISNAANFLQAWVHRFVPLTQIIWIFEMELMVRSAGSTHLEIVKQAGGYGWYNAQWSAKWMWVRRSRSRSSSSHVRCSPLQARRGDIFSLFWLLDWCYLDNTNSKVYVGPVQSGDFNLYTSVYTWLQSHVLLQFCKIGLIWWALIVRLKSQSKLVGRRPSRKLV